MKILKNLSVAFLFTAASAIAPIGSYDASGAEKHDHADEHDHAEKHDHAAKHGGQIIELANHQSVEMVTRGSEVSFYIMEDDKPADLHGGSFRIFVQSGANVMSATLEVDGNRLRATLANPMPAGAKVVVTGKDGHGHVLQARFVKK